MLKINMELASKVFNNHVEVQKKGILIENDSETAEKRIDGVNKKVIHTYEVLKDGTKVAQILGFNESALALQQISLLDHDIGRFMQMRFTGNYHDNKLKESNLFPADDHGKLGKLILDRQILKEQIPNSRIYDDVIATSVGTHVTARSDIKDLKPLINGTFTNEEMYDFLSKCDLETKRHIISSITQIVQDVDRLEIYNQILSDRWTPIKNDMSIDKKVFEMFYNGEYLDMANLRSQGLWNANVGDLLRLGFINQIRLLSVAKMILDEDLIMKMKEKRQNPIVGDAFEFAQNKLEQMVKNSEDGLTVAKVYTR